MRKTAFGLAFATALTLALGACKRNNAVEPLASARADSPAAPSGPAHGGAQALSGRVTETMDAGGYTYLKLATTTGEVWAAVRQTKVSTGQQATVMQAMLMTDFSSPSLKRKFERIYFGALAGAAASHPPSGGMMGGGQGGGMMGRPGAGDLQVAHGRIRSAAKVALDRPLPKAPGPNAYTIAELYAQRAALAGKTVRLRGQVTKFNAEIMGRNWVHLQDGSGSSEQDDFDLTVTTKAVASPGQVVLVEGQLQQDRDFGAGYRYSVIVEGATLK